MVTGIVWVVGKGGWKKRGLIRGSDPSYNSISVPLSAVRGSLPSAQVFHTILDLPHRFVK